MTSRLQCPNSWSIGLTQSAPLLKQDMLTSLTTSVRKIEASQPPTINKENWVVNISKKPLSSVERSILEKGPKFAPTPRKVPTKDIVAEVEAAIVRLPEDTKENLYEQQRRQSFIGPIYHPITISQKLKGKH